jgi:sugar transferase (PEP-CTERM/EpsH1 system associated)
MFYTATELAQEHDVELLVIEEAPSDEQAAEELEERFEAVHVREYPKYRFYLNALRGVASRKPLQTHYYRFDSVSRWLAANHDRFDLFYCNHVRTAEYVGNYDCPAVLDLVDAISRNYKKASENASGVWRAIYPIEWRRLRRYERRVVTEFDHSFIITEADRQFVTKGEDWPSVSVLPNGVKPSLLERELKGYRSDVTDPKIVFLGKMDYFPNVDAAVHFAANVFPDIREQFPAAEFLIVGANPERRVQTLGDGGGVTVTGFVEDPREYLNMADVVVAPMRYGAGLQNKVLEAMALGRPVVTSPLAREGIDAINGTHLVVAEGDRPFADAVRELLGDVEYRRELGIEARRLIERKYTWNRIGKMLRERVGSVLRGGTGRRSR